jgi:hypothetical protein
MGAVAFMDGTLEVADNGGFSGANHITVKMGQGGLSWTESDPAIVKMDRGSLDHWRPAEEVPVQFSFTAEDRGLIAASGTTNTATALREALFALSSASDWATCDTNAAVYTVQVRLSIVDPSSGTGDSVILFANAKCETFEYTEGTEENTFTASFRGLQVRPTVS